MPGNTAIYKTQKSKQKLPLIIYWFIQRVSSGSRLYLSILPLISNLVTRYIINGNLSSREALHLTFFVRSLRPHDEDEDHDEQGVLPGVVEVDG